MQDKIESAKTILRDANSTGIPALMCSFGKDSMVLLHLIREAFPRTGGPNDRAYPMPVICWKQPGFPQKQRFANKVIQKWGLEVHDWFPSSSGIKVNDEHIELVSRYSIGNNNYMDVPLNTLPPEAHQFRQEYLCGLQDWVMRPKCELTEMPWDVLIHGHKSSDVDPFEGSVPLKTDRVRFNDKMQLFFPLHNWTDKDVWGYLNNNYVEYHRARYAPDGTEYDDKWQNPDYCHACTRCLDHRNPGEVMCPKLNKMVPNISSRIVRLQHRPDYIDKKEALCLG